MDEAGNGEILKPYLMRSTTPVVSEKVLDWMNKSMDGGDGMSEMSGVRARSATNRSRSQRGSSRPEDQQSNIDSNMQEHSQSTETVNQVPEPGPHDPPGPRYESYDSGPSFGNMGPLPADDMATSNPYGIPTWQLQLQQQDDGSPKNIPWGVSRSVTQAANIPLPVSDSSPSRVASPPRVISPSQSGSRMRSPPMTTNGSRAQPSGLMSPTKSRMPPDYSTLSPSGNDDDDWVNLDPVTPHSKVRSTLSRVSSLSPSDSPSQVMLKPKKNKSSELTNVSAQDRPFSPYRHAPTNEDLVNAAARNRALVIPEESEPPSERQQSVAGSRISKAESVHSKAPSVAASKTVSTSPSKASRVESQHSKTPSMGSAHSKAPSMASAHSKAPSMSSAHSKSQSVASVHTQKTASKQAESVVSHRTARSDRTERTTNRAQPALEDLDVEESRIVDDVLASSKTPRTSYAASTLEPEIVNSHFHDNDLCVLLQQESDPTVHEVVKKALRKAIRQRVKKLGMKYDNESINQYKQQHHNHDHSQIGAIMAGEGHQEDYPQWAMDIRKDVALLKQNIESLAPKIEKLQPMRSRSVIGGTSMAAQTPATQTIQIDLEPAGTVAGSMFQPPIEEVVLEGEDQSEQAAFDNMEQDAPTPRGHSQALSVVQSHGGYADECDDSPGQQLLEQELYKLRVKASSSVQGGLTHAPSQLSNPASYEVVPDTQEIEEEMHVAGLPTIPDTNGDAAPEDPPSPPLPPVPVDDDAQDQQLGALWNQNAMYNGDLPPWQLVHKRLLGWAMVWPLSEIDAALNSTTRGHQVDEVALSIWSTQTYKRYVRSRLMDVPPSRVDRLFVPPNIADAINTAVYNGRHGDASSMLRDLWTSFGLDGMPRLLIVLAKHRHDESHWVVHRFSLPEGGLSTYDSFPQKTLPDGRPLGWWFAIRTAWPNAIYPSPDHLVQKMIRLHRPMQLPIDNSVAAAGIWRNVLMGSRGERSVDLERVRDLINTEVKNLRMRKTMGKLAIAAPRPTWQGMNDMA